MQYQGATLNAIGPSIVTSFSMTLCNNQSGKYCQLMYALSIPTSFPAWLLLHMIINAGIQVYYHD